MKLDHATVAPLVSTTVRAGKSGVAVDGAPDTGAPASPEKVGKSDKGVSVRVSSLARNLAQARAGGSGDVDQKKVDAMRTAIANGSFKVNAGAIADKMLANAEEILRRQAQ